MDGSEAQLHPNDEPLLLPERFARLTWFTSP